MGNMSGSYGSHYTLWQSITQNSQDIANNKSNVTVNMYLSFDGSSYYAYTNYATSGSMTINGSTTNYSIASINFSSGQAKDILLATWTGDIEHNPDGTKTLSVSGSWNTDTTRIGSGSCSATKTLSTIPRASSISCSTANIEENAVITISSASNSFTHTVIAYFGNETVTVATGKPGGSFQWTIPSSFYAQIPNAKTGVGTIRCQTYNGGTLIGTKDAVLNISTSETRCKPSISGTVVDTNQTTINLTGDANKLIKYKSTAKATISASAKNSASISKKVINGTTVSGNELSIANVSATSFNFETVDSRGYSNSTTVTPSMIDYIPLTINANFFRPQPTTGEVQLTYSGNYFNGSFGSVSNTLSITWKYKKSTDSSYTTGGTITPTLSGNKISQKTISLGTSFDYQTAYDFQLIAVDKLTTFTQTANVSVGMPVYYWGKDFFDVVGDLYPLKEIIKNSRIAKLPRGWLNADKSFDEALTTGVYDVDYSALNGPFQTWGYLDVQVANGDTWDKSSNWIWQTFYQTGGAIYQRSATNGGSFSPWQRIYRETSLFDNSSGTTGTVTLSESAANFSYLEVFIGRYDNNEPTYLNSVRVYSPNGSHPSLQNVWRVSDTMIQIQAQNITISGTSITRTNESYINLLADGTVSGGIQTSLRIFKVIGYR